MTPTPSQIARAPKVVLHDHLDGGLRPHTVAEIAAEIGHRLPVEPSALGHWFAEAADSGSLDSYLDCFAHTIAVMQRPQDLTRVAREAVEDLAADGVVYAELRWAPELHQRLHMRLGTAVGAVWEGLQAGMAHATAVGTPIVVGQILTAMRESDRSLEIAKLAAAERARGVVGFDIAGLEEGYPPILHQAAVDHAKAAGLPVTIHAGEGFGLPSIEQAIGPCHADRIGHGVRIIEDIEMLGSTTVLGDLALRVRDSQICLELCPSSNVNTHALGGVTSLADYPLALLDQLGFCVTVNSDNRLMSQTNMTRELSLVADAFGLEWDDIERLTLNAMRSAFCAATLRDEIIEQVIKPGFAELKR
ncbi:MAG: adenosine deaminase [Aeromicrobium sp.]|nr:MAG: adenosine deaminase [Aeromicrobium sp.]